jgi:outer membrane protein assembly factor BamB
MNFEKSKTKAILATFLVLTFAATLVALPAANAHTPPWTMQTYSYIAVSPNTVGVGQFVYVVVWVSPNPPTAMGIAGDRWRNMTVTITKPNGDTETLGPYYSDPTGSTFTSYTPNQVGTYKFVFNFPGQVLSQTGPTGLTANTADLISRGTYVWINDTYTASSATTYLTVQEEPVTEPPTYPLPTEYWTRPIEGQNTAWSSVASNFLGTTANAIYGRLQQDGPAPNSAHIMWNKEIEFGGIVGGTNASIVGGDYAIPNIAYYAGQSYEGRFTNPLILQGRLYYPDPLGHSGSGGGYTCVDLQTGQTLWHSDTIGNLIGNTSAGAPNVTPIPSFGQLLNYESQNQHGVVGGLLWATSTVYTNPLDLSTANITWQAFDPFTGKWLFNETGVPPSYTVGPVTQSVQDITTNTGAIVRYVLNYNTTAKSGWLALWNNTQHNVGLELVDPEGGLGTNAYQWRPNGKSVDMSKAYSWNVTTIPALPGLQYDAFFNIVTGYPAIVQVLPGDLILGRSSSFTSRGGTINPYTMWAISDKPASRGQLLWLKNYPAPAGNLSRGLIGGTPVDPVNRVFIMNDLETMQLYGYSLDTGDLLWGPIGKDIPAFQYYSSVGTSNQYGYVAYGNVYIQGYGGAIYCYNTKNGNLLWTYNNTFSAHETPWGDYPIFVGAIADGKVYAYNSEHSPNFPLYKGERIRCINATTGEEIWTLLGWYSVGGFDSGTAPVADGYLVYRSAYDNQIYCIGKGPSATTVTASPKVSVLGDSVLIEGTVTDISAGTRQSEQAARFPTGVPAASDDSMSAWMEYVYMQKPCPTNSTGVTVTLDVVDANGNYRSIGTATTDTSGTFSYMWQPDIPGKYTLIATFQGSESYYASYMETAFGVSEAPVATPTPTPLTLPPYESYTIGAAVAVIIAIAIAVLLLYRRH